MFEKLLSLVGDNAEAKTLIESYETDISKEKTELQSRITSLTSQFEEAKTTRDLYKQGNALVKSALGLDTINEETVKASITALSKDDAATELAKKLSEKDTEIEAIRNQNAGEIMQMQIGYETEKALNDISDVLVDDAILRDSFKRYLVEGIGSVEGVVAPVQRVGDKLIPVMDGDKPQSISAYARKMLESDSYKSFHKTSVKGSAGKTGSGEAGISGKFAGSPDERRTAIQNMMNKG